MTGPAASVTPANVNVELLRSAASPVLQGLREPDLELLAAAASCVDLRKGDVLLEEGGPPDALYVVVEGELDVLKQTPQGETLLNTCRAGDPVGELSLVTGSPRSATVRAAAPTRLIRIPAEAFHRVLASPEAALAMLGTVRRRLENQEATLRQQARLIALGTYTAGVMHELNNPAAAVQRSVSRLHALLEELVLRSAELGPLVATVRASLPTSVGTTDPLERADREDRVREWLEEHGVDDAWELASRLGGIGWDHGDLDRLAAQDVPMVAALGWAAAHGHAHELLVDARDAARRISEIVADSKSYARTDEAPVGEVDVHEGIRVSLALLRHTMPDGVTVVLDQAEDLPRIEGYPSELNTVWTNLIENALDAMRAGGGTLTVRSAWDDEVVRVVVADTGHGIPPDVVDRIYDPFFTPKPVGDGTGLGLSQVHGIVTRRHRGTLDVATSPEGTAFTVTLPRTLRARG